MLPLLFGKSVEKTHAHVNGRGRNAGGQTEAAPCPIVAGYPRTETSELVSASSDMSLASMI
jgi:hypothetical protein